MGPMLEPLCGNPDCGHYRIEHRYAGKCLSRGTDCPCMSYVPPRPHEGTVRPATKGEQL